MNRVETADTRPRMASGVTICTRLWRTYTLTMSAPPSTASAATESHSPRDRAKPRVATPNTATARNIQAPA